MFLGGLAAFGVLAVLGATVFGAIFSGGQRTQLKNLAGQTLTQTAYVITTEANTSGAYPVAAAFKVAAPNPTGGGQIPDASAAPKTDAWATPIGYCTNTASAQSHPVFAVVSAGPDKTFQTTCTQALAGTIAGDDAVRVKSAANVVQGVGGTIYYGDPVADATALSTLVPAQGYTPKNGEHRLNKATGQTVYWNGSAWVNQVPTAAMQANSGDNCDAYGIGAQARDSAGNLMVCQ